MRVVVGEKVSNAVEAVNAIEGQLNKMDDLSLHTIGTIVDKIRSDRVLPLLDLSDAYAVAKRNEKGDVIVVVGPRDWQFDTLGILKGSGTMQI